MTVDRVLLRRCDRVARGVNRSKVFEQALEKWLREQRRETLESEVEHYYASLSRREKAEDAAWANLASRVLGETWS